MMTGRAWFLGSDLAGVGTAMITHKGRAHAPTAHHRHTTRRRVTPQGLCRPPGVHPEALRGWVSQAEIDNGTRPGMRTEDQKRIAELERENRELRRANEILKAASAYFARELDPRLPR